MVAKLPHYAGIEPAAHAAIRAYAAAAGVSIAVATERAIDALTNYRSAVPADPQTDLPVQRQGGTPIARHGDVPTERLSDETPQRQTDETASGFVGLSGRGHVDKQTLAERSDDDGENGAVAPGT